MEEETDEVLQALQSISWQPKANAERIDLTSKLISTLAPPGLSVEGTYISEPKDADQAKEDGVADYLAASPDEQ